MSTAATSTTTAPTRVLAEPPRRAPSASSTAPGDGPRAREIELRGRGPLSPSGLGDRGAAAPRRPRHADDSSTTSAGGLPPVARRALRRPRQRRRRSSSSPGGRRAAAACANAARACVTRAVRPRRRPQPRRAYFPALGLRRCRRARPRLARRRQSVSAVPLIVESPRHHRRARRARPPSSAARRGSLLIDPLARRRPAGPVRAPMTDTAQTAPRARGARRSRSRCSTTVSRASPAR